MDSPALVEAPDAVLGRSDPTRRWAMARPPAAPAFPGLTRGEIHTASGVLPSPECWDEYLVAVSLPVLLSDGAGPYLLDAGGHLVLAVGEHPEPDVGLVALGPLGDSEEQMGIVEPLGAERNVWRWVVRARLDAAGRVDALDALDEVTDEAGLREWERAAQGQD